MRQWVVGDITTILNAPSREECTARRERTNTPQQALLLLNEPEYLRAAGHLAERLLELPEAAAAVWIEQECSDDDHDDLLMAWAERVETAVEVLFAEQPRDVERLLAIRHAVPAGVNEQVVANGMPKVGTDFAVPTPR